MANTTIKCDIPGCKFERTYESEIVGKRVLGFHKRKAHGIKGVHFDRNAKTKREYKKRRMALVPHPTPSVPPTPLNLSTPQQTPSEGDYRKIVVICPCCSTLIKIETAKL